MKIYIDSSWLLRVLLKQSGVAPLPANAEVYSSMLLNVECRRTLDRHYQRRLISDASYVSISQQLQQYLEKVNMLELSSDVVGRAAEPFFLPIGTLEALHLATALKIREVVNDIVHLATFDDELALVATAHDLRVL
jgi:predicted nucleic acid-binding protein